MKWQRDQQGQWEAVDLNLAVSPKCRFRLTEAHDINDDEWIVGAGKDRFGRIHAFVLIPGELCIGDQNCDGLVDVDDLSSVVVEWGSCPTEPDSICQGDVDDDGDVDVDDLSTVVINWGPCPYPTLDGQGSEDQAPEAVQNCIELHMDDTDAMLDCLTGLIDTQ